MAPKVREASCTEEVKALVDFGITDRKGRAIGAQIATWEAEYVPVAADQADKDYGPEGWYINRQPGRYYGFRPWATRNGKHYGAMQPSYLYATTEEREAAIAKYLDSARKRNAKLFAPEEVTVARPR